jgi:glucose dehydrogenase
MRKLRFLLVATALIAATVVALATASQNARTAGSVSPSAETAWPWEPKGSIPAGTAGNNWEHGKADLASTQFSYFKQLTPNNVGKLRVAWQGSYAPPDYSGGIQGSPIVVSGKGKNLPLESGTMFLAANKGVVALDPTSGKILWQFIGPNPKPNTPGGTPAAQLQFGNTTKYFTYCAGYITTGQQDGSITAINAKTGAPVWNNQVSAVSEFAGHTGQTSPPTDCDPNGGPKRTGIVFGGPNGSSSPLRGHLDGIDLKTGALVWRWFTTPDPTQLPFILTWGNPAEAALGGGGTWSSTAIDPAMHQIYSATGNAYAQLGRQPGKNLWTASVFSLDENTGALKWYFQESHHDNWDMDHGNAVMIFNVKIDGKTYPAFVGCDKHGWCEALDRRNGTPLPKFPTKEVPVLDPSGQGLKLNSEWPTQPESGCQPTCAMANLLIHTPTDADAALAFPTYPFAPDGKPMKVEPQFASRSSDYYSIQMLSGGNGINYNRNSYDPLTNNFYTCATNQFTASRNVSPTDWHWASIGGSTISVWLSAVNMSNNTMSWQRKFVGGIYKDGELVGGDNPGFPKGVWSGGCFGGIITTAGNLLFIAPRWDVTRGSPATFTAADPPYGGVVAAFNATTGDGPLWTWQAPDQINGSPITYSVNGKQYVAVYHKLPNVGSPLYSGHGEQLTAFTL